MTYPASFLDYCASINLKLTSVRKGVLFILWCAEKPLKAYEILDHLVQIKQNSKPPTIYRVLDYFVDYGVVHKIESIQSYTLCHEPAKHRPSEILMVCSNCYQVSELYDDAIHNLLEKLSQASEFHLGKDAIELKGICSQCYSANLI
ncbi:transcriptional repressor [Legionella fairfieldensis]|uniref:transcriptional repressor n=1 Tax=Legionella fairfieldensis TaxID=45064 RepID=UPI0006844D3F|nr:transcriptional repressor [Legionella fairfieldensis]